MIHNGGVWLALAWALHYKWDLDLESSPLTQRKWTLSLSRLLEMDLQRSQGLLFNNTSGHTGPVLLNFSFITIAEGTEWQTLAITQRVWDFALVEPDPRVRAARGQIRSSPLSRHLRDTRSKQQKTHAALCGTSPRRGNGDRLGCLFTICSQSCFDAAPCLSFSKTTKRHSQ